LQQKETKYLWGKQKRKAKQRKRKGRRRSTLAHSSVLKWRHHELTPALEKEKIRGGEEQIEGFAGYPAPIISCLQPPIYPHFFHLSSSSHALFLLFPN
jgi:hypothetical protein